MVTQLEIEQKVQLGEDLLAAYAQGAMSEQLGIPGGAALQGDAVTLWGRIFPVPISEGWVPPTGIKPRRRGVFPWDSAPPPPPPAGQAATPPPPPPSRRSSKPGGWKASEAGAGYLAESGKVGIASILSMFRKKAGQAAQAAKGKVGPTLKLIAGVTIPTVLSYAGYVWLTEGDRADMRRINLQRDLQEKAMQIKDPAAQARALDVIARGVPGRPITSLGWVAIIGGIAVVGLLLWTQRPKR